MTTVKRPVGRPSKYKPEYAAQIVEFCKQGYSLTAAADELAVDRSTLNEWARQHPEFSVAMSRARAAACRWYEERLRERTDGQGTPKAAIFGVQNLGRDDWRESEKGPSITIHLETNLGSGVPVIDLSTSSSPRLEYDIPGVLAASDSDSDSDG